MTVSRSGRSARSAPDHRGVRARRARGEDVVLREHECVGEDLDQLLVQKPHVARAEEPDVLRAPGLDGDELLQVVQVARPAVGVQRALEHGRGVAFGHGVRLVAQAAGVVAAAPNQELLVQLADELVGVERADDRAVAAGAAARLPGRSVARGCARTQETFPDPPLDRNGRARRLGGGSAGSRRVPGDRIDVAASGARRETRAARGARRDRLARHRLSDLLTRDGGRAHRADRSRAATRLRPDRTSRSRHRPSHDRRHGHPHSTPTHTPSHEPPLARPTAFGGARREARCSRPVPRRAGFSTGEARADVMWRLGLFREKPRERGKSACAHTMSRKNW